jgi:glutaminase
MSVYQCWSDRRDILVSCLKNPKEKIFLAFILISGSPTIDYNLEVAQSEKDLVLNAALANLKSFGNIENDVDTVLVLFSSMFHRNDV